MVFKFPAGFWVWYCVCGREHGGACVCLRNCISNGCLIVFMFLSSLPYHLCIFVASAASPLSDREIKHRAGAIVSFLVSSANLIAILLLKISLKANQTVFFQSKQGLLSLLIARMCTCLL